jgi:hypothetical protein
MFSDCCAGVTCPGKACPRYAAVQPKKIPYWNAPAKGPYAITLACQTCRYLLLISLGLFAWLTLLTAIRSAEKKTINRAMLLLHTQTDGLSN